jgi:RNA polymerase sigma factor (sigma-70 family)
MKRSVKEQIANDIRSGTWRYFQNTEMYFCDYIFGDPYYVTLKDVVYRYICDSELDWVVMHGMTGIIDVVELVTRLYEVFIKVDTYFRRQYPAAPERGRKNYLMKCLRKATPRLLQEQLDCHSRICQDINELQDNGFQYISLFCHDGRLIEEISLKRWNEDQAKSMEQDRRWEKLKEASENLNPLERSVIALLLTDCPYREIAERLHLQKDSVRKIIYSAKIKMRDRHESLN